jgi:hypothetical protein
VQQLAGGLALFSGIYRLGFAMPISGGEPRQALYTPHDTRFEFRASKENDMVDDAEEYSNPMVLIELQLVTRKGVVFRKKIGDSIHNACWWMKENAEDVEKLWEEHINDEPKFQMIDVAQPQGYDV